MKQLISNKKNELAKKKKKGFTLVELIIVIAIIAILAAIAIPKFGEVTKNSKIKADIATAKNIHGITAQCIADGSINSAISDDSTNSIIIGKIDGANGNMPKLKSDSSKTFAVSVDSDGNIKITDGKLEIYPNGTSIYK